MTESYDPKTIEPKWQAQWEEDNLYHSKVDWSKPKHYALTMLPYPSGDLHIGHWFAMVPSDARARWMRMKGYNVLFPMGFDAFGLPAENAAVQRNIHPWKWTYANIERMRKQLRSMGAMFDWGREAISSTPNYYMWTQWFFREFYKNDLAYRDEALVNWSPTLQTVLANEQVIDGKDERTGQPVIQKMMTQWFFRYTRYADEMLDFEHIDWPEPVKIMQENWIGRSEGARVTFTTENGNEIEVFTTRPDTLWGATFMVLAPEHPLVDSLTTDEQRDEVEAYREVTAQATEIERMSTEREKTGVFTGGYAINPVNDEKIPVWIADYVLSSYGTGAIMAVPAHDERDFAFARKFDLSITPVIQPEGEDTLTGDTMEHAYVGPGVMMNSDHFDGTEVNEEKGRKNPGISAVIDWLEDEGIGSEAINYRLRDWLISRQRYWGCPIPIVYKQDGTPEVVPDNGLPVELPEDIDFDPSGRSPLTYHEPFLNTTDSEGNPARRETDTMDTFMCSSWYHYRYLSPNYEEGPFDPEEAAYWLPVDVYTGGAEHATMHLLYTRWFAKAMRDLGMFDETVEVMKEHGRDPEEILRGEPMLLLRNQGQVLGAERPGDFILATGEYEGEKFVADHVQVMAWQDAPDEFDGVMGELVRRTENILHVASDESVTVVEVADDATVNIPRVEGEGRVEQLQHHLEVQRMSKSKGNVVNPDDLVEQYGTDIVRAYLMFAFDWQKGGPWDPEGIKGPVRFLHDVWEIVTSDKPEMDGEASEKEIKALRRKVHQMNMRVTDGLENFSFNTSVAALMELKNTMRDAANTPVARSEAWDEAVETIVKMMAPFTPFVAEELWHRLGHTESVHLQPWPEADPEAAKEDEITLVVQINGKVRDRVDVPADIDAEEAKSTALSLERIQEMTEGKEPKKVIYVPGRLVNIVV